MEITTRTNDETSGGTLGGRVAMVTGASRGIGAAIARALSAAGAAVAVNYNRSTEEAEALADELARPGSLAVAGDVCDEEQMQAAVARVGETLGPVDILVCSATGVTDVTPGPLLDKDAQRLGADISAQLDAVLVPARTVAPGMAERGHGHLVAVSSTWSRRPVSGFGDVAIAKATADAAMRSLAVELGPYGVRANVVAPGFVHTARSENLPEEARAAVIDNTPLRRAAEPADVADAVLGLVGPPAGHLSGTYLPVDGGVALT